MSVLSFRFYYALADSHLERVVCPLMVAGFAPERWQVEDENCPLSVVTAGVEVGIGKT